MNLMRFAVFEQHLKWLALCLGVGSTISVVQGWQLAAMGFSLPFCLIWVYCAWLRREKQLKYINILFSAFYVYGLARYAVLYG